VNSVKTFGFKNMDRFKDNTEPSRAGNNPEGVTVRTRRFMSNKAGNGSKSALDLKTRHDGMRSRDDLTHAAMHGDGDKKPCPPAKMPGVTTMATFLDPADFSFRKGLRTRYAKRMARSEFYGVVTVNNLPA
jgi:hypothetical protein